jgi:hypothetical protein
VLRWEQGREAIEKMIADGHLQMVPANRDYADGLVAQARAYLESARTIAAANPDAGYVLAYDACRKALTAILENQGLRPTSRGGHIAVIDAAIAQLDPPLGGALRPVDRMRARRNRIEYPSPGVAPVTDKEVAETLPKAVMVIDAATRVLDAMPTWS